MATLASLEAAPSARNARGIADSFATPEWYLRRFAANIRVRAETVAALTEGMVFSRVLDIGCGDGSLSLPLLPRARRMTLLDPSAAMLARVADRVDPRDRPAVDFVNSGFMEAKLPLGGFDLVLCLGVLAYVRDLEPFLSEVAAVLQPGGRLILECTDAAHCLSRLERAYQSVTALVRAGPFSTYPHREKEVISAAGAQGLRGDVAFRYAYGAPVISRLLSPRRTYELIRRLYGTVGDNRRSRLGNQCIFSLARRSFESEVPS